MNEPQTPHTTLTDGSPVTEDHRELDPTTGLQRGYIVLSVDERAKGFVRPVRSSYTHVGIRPLYPLRLLTEEERKSHGRDHHGHEYVKFEEYPESESPIVGRAWTQEQLDNRGCGTVTTMALSIAETYARDPSFYGGTFCSHCRRHFPVGPHGEFVWAGTNEKVGT